MRRALISALVTLPLAAFSAGYAQSPRSAHKAALASSAASAKFEPVLGAIHVDSTDIPFEVKIEPSASGSGNSSIEDGGDRWDARGFTLRSLIAELFQMDARLVDVPAELDTARYDLSLSAPVELDHDSMQRVIVKALSQKFGLTVQPQTRTMDVYVLSVPEGPASGLKRHSFPRHNGLKRVAAGQDDAGDEGGRITYTGQDCSGVSSGGITVEGGTIADFRRTLEPDLDRVLIDETSLRGSYDFKIGLYANQTQLFELMRVALGLVVTPSQRAVTVLTVRPAEAQPVGAMLQAKL